MTRMDRDSGVFVVTPGPVVLFFPKVRELLADLRHMESEERESASFYTVAGEMLSLVGSQRMGFHLAKTGEFDDDALQAALAAVADDPEAETDPRVVASQVIKKRKWRWLPLRRP